MRVTGSACTSPSIWAASCGHNVLRSLSPKLLMDLMVCSHIEKMDVPIRYYALPPKWLFGLFLCDPNRLLASSRTYPYKQIPIDNILNTQILFSSRQVG